jgi:hypothetical protein
MTASIQSTASPFSRIADPRRGARAEPSGRVACASCHRLHVARSRAGVKWESTPQSPHSRSFSSPSLSLWPGSPRRKMEANCHRSLLRAHASSPSHHRPPNPVHYSANIPSTSFTRCLTRLCRGEGEFRFPPPRVLADVLSTQRLTVASSLRSPSSLPATCSGFRGG